MQHFKLLLVIFGLVIGLLGSPLTAANPDCWPDSLEEITISGTVRVDTLNKHLNYFLDIEDDGSSDFKLNFGPYWYQPDSGSALRPNDGEYVEVFGLVNDCREDGYPIIIVLEINGEFWRDFYEPFWNRMSKDRKRHRNSYRNHKGFAFGWLNDSLQIVELQGVTLVDSIAYFSHLYLDVDQDTVPDYFLNFGPPWYQPASGLQRPQEGDTVTISGPLIEKNNVSIVFVFELNGEVWIDSTGLGTQMGGGWIHRKMNQERKIQTAFDSLCYVQIRQGWNDGQPKGNMNLPESLYGQMLQLLPQNIPYTAGEHVFAGFEIGLFTPARKNLMVLNDSVGAHLQFATKIQYQFHYNENQLEGKNRNENSLRLKIWNHADQKWEEVENAVFDRDENTVRFESEIVPSLVILTADEATAIADEDQIVVREFILKQNYPNPFNPFTTIEFSLNQDARVVLSVYNVLGQKLLELANERFEAGTHRLQLDGSQLSSGLYFYELKAGQESRVMKMTLIK